MTDEPTEKERAAPALSYGQDLPESRNWKWSNL